MSIDMLRCSRVYALAVVLAFGQMPFVGCNTLPIKTSDTLSLTSRLSQAQTREAVLVALGAYASKEQPTSNAAAGPAAMMPEKSFTLGLTYYRRGEAAQRTDWYAEGADADSVIAAYQRGHLYLKVRILIDAGDMRFEILEAENLKFTGSHVHKRAYSLIDQLKATIRRAAGQATLASSHRAQ